VSSLPDAPLLKQDPPSITGLFPNLAGDLLMNVLAGVLLSLTVLSADQPVEKAASPTVLTVRIKSREPITFTADDLEKFERTTVRAVGKDENKHAYEGVTLAAILGASGIKWGTKCSLWLDCYAVVEGADEYLVVFSIPEIDPGLARKTVLLADRCDGKPLAKTVGPYQIIEEDSKQHGRWVQQVVGIRVCMVPD
jgi:hypothetical protein